MDRGALWATVYRVIKSWTLLKGLSTHLTWVYKEFFKKVHFLPPPFLLNYYCYITYVNFKVHKVMI